MKTTNTDADRLALLSDSDAEVLKSSVSLLSLVIQFTDDYSCGIEKTARVLLTIFCRI